MTSKNLMIFSFSLLSVIALFLLPYLFLGEEMYVLIHDNLDSEFIYLHLLKVNGLLFSLDYHARIDNIMNGLPVHFMHSQFNVVRVWFALFDSFDAYAINSIVVRVVGFVGMFLISRDYLLGAKKIFAIPLAFLYAFIPLYSLYGTTVSGLPIVLWAFLNIKNRRLLIVSFLVVATYPFYSHLVLIAPFIASLLVGYYFYCRFHNLKISNLFVWALGLMLLLFCISNASLLFAFFTDQQDSSRSVWNPDSKVRTMKTMIFTALTGQYHSSHFSALPILFFISISVLQIRKRLHICHRLILVLGLIVLISLFYGIYPYLRFFTRDYLYILTSFKFDRFTFLLPLLWFIAFALAIKYSKLKTYFIGCFIVIQFGIIVLANSEIRTNYLKVANLKSEAPSFQRFFAVELFDKIKAVINKPNKDYRVVSIGMHPSIAQYNGLYTLDSYQNNYSLDYKMRFREVILPELSKNVELQASFDNWGSRCYIFSSELYKNCRYNCNKNIRIRISDLDLDMEALRELGCEYILSAVPVLNYEDLHLSFLGSFSHDSSLWRVYLYKL